MLDHRAEAALCCEEVRIESSTLLVFVRLLKSADQSVSQMSRSVGKTELVGVHVYPSILDRPLHLYLHEYSSLSIVL